MYKQGCHSDMQITISNLKRVSYINWASVHEYESLAGEPCFKKGLLPKVCENIFPIVFAIFVVHPYQDHIWAEKFSQWVGGAEDGGGAEED